MIRFSVRLVICYAHVFVPLKVVIVTDRIGAVFPINMRIKCSAPIADNTRFMAVFFS